MSGGTPQGEVEARHHMPVHADQDIGFIERTWRVPPTVRYAATWTRHALLRGLLLLALIVPGFAEDKLFACIDMHFIGYPASSIPERDYSVVVELVNHAGVWEGTTDWYGEGDAYIYVRWYGTYLFIQNGWTGLPSYWDDWIAILPPVTLVNGLPRPMTSRDFWYNGGGGWSGPIGWGGYYKQVTMGGRSDMPIDGPQTRRECTCHSIDVAGPEKKSADPVWYHTGEMEMYEDDFGLTDIGLLIRRHYSNLTQTRHSTLGDAWMLNIHPRLIDVGGTDVAVRLEGGQQIGFNRQVGGGYLPIRANRATLADSSGDVVFTDVSGARMVFHGFSTALPERQRGSLKALYTVGGERRWGVFDPVTGHMTEWRRSITPDESEVIRFTYGLSQMPGLLTRAERWRDRISVGNQLLNRVDYVYYQDGSSGLGPTGSLRGVIIGDGTVVHRRFFYAYYVATEQSAGTVTGVRAAMRCAIGPRNMARLAVNGLDPIANAVDINQLLPYADKRFTYDSASRVTSQVLQTPDVDGSGTYAYAYYPRASVDSPTSNDWIMKTVESQPDGSQNVVFTNLNGDPMLKVLVGTDGSVKQAEAFRYDADWNMSWRIHASAMAPVGQNWYDESKGDLLDFASGDSPYVKNAQGLIERWTYVPAATIPSGTYPQQQSVQVGEFGTAALVKAYTYVGHTN